jgi:O-antigen/teichoic acid export membrane protein
MVTTVCIPIAFCSDRIVLSHVSTSEAVTKYSIILQLFAPVSALIVACAQPLWPMFSRARRAGTPGPNLHKVLAAFFLGTFATSLTVALLADPLGRIIGGDQLRLGHLLPALGALVVLVQSLAYPLSITMMDAKGARFVAGCAVLTVPLNIGLSIWLSIQFGAAGPLVAVIVVCLFVQVMPVLRYIQRRDRLSLGVLETPALVATS